MTQGREIDGRYSAGLHRPCKCGHTLGDHIGEGPVAGRACIAHELPGGPSEPCGCQGFRLSAEPRRPYTGSKEPTRRRGPPRKKTTRGAC